MTNSVIASFAETSFQNKRAYAPRAEGITGKKLIPTVPCGDADTVHAGSPVRISFARIAAGTTETTLALPYARSSPSAPFAEKHFKAKQKPAQAVAEMYKRGLIRITPCNSAGTVKTGSLRNTYFVRFAVKLRDSSIFESNCAKRNITRRRRISQKNDQGVHFTARGLIFRCTFSTSPNWLRVLFLSYAY